MWSTPWLGAPVAFTLAVIVVVSRTDDLTILRAEFRRA